MAYREKSVTCHHPGGSHEMVYSDWGSVDAPNVLVCVHGLTRNGRDFDRLAAALAGPKQRIIAPDIVGRGRSGHLGPEGVYEIPQYIEDLRTLFRVEELSSVDWLGTSMGGLIGMTYSAMPGHAINRMLINDVGPFIPKTALQRIGEYVGIGWRFDSFDKALEHIKKAYAPFGLTREDDWRELAEISLVQLDDGTFVNAYDLRIAEPFQATALDNIDLWPVWDAINVPVTVLRGVESDLFLPETAAEMAARGPKATVVSVKGCGHAPALMDEPQIDLIRRWIDGDLDKTKATMI